MRLANLFVVLLVIYVVCAITTTSSKSTLETSDVNDDGSKALWTHDGNKNDAIKNEIGEGEGEESVANSITAQHWFSKPVDKMYQKWFDLRNKEGIAYDTSPEAIRKMIKSKLFQTKTFDRWNNYSMEDIKRAIGELKLNNDEVAGMLVNYVQNYRVYRLRGKESTNRAPVRLLKTATYCELDPDIFPLGDPT
ncbi:hypothetical protein GN244_ATG18533 [Phytophthora infestans]|uniref:RxLR effector protein n=1 Tax=Phytophthora infestans TaxID=4787 RepID=A0A833W4Q6_PHYIN|nr:hypothetical protein GN244_ATG18533 [Phytophthora infestans]KAF4149613.1 hypothetical protein GN958_ATG01197 [Phytophthora infestans]